MPVGTQFLAPKLPGQCVGYGADVALWGIRALFCNWIFALFRFLKRGRRLYGNHIDTASGSWVLSDGGIGNISLLVTASFSSSSPFPIHSTLGLAALSHVRFTAGTNSDSFIEYLAKGQQAVVLTVVAATAIRSSYLASASKRNAPQQLLSWASTLQITAPSSGRAPPLDTRPFVCMRVYTHTRTVDAHPCICEHAHHTFGIVGI